MKPATLQPVVDATASLMAFRRLLRTASRFYHANPANPPRIMNLGDDDVQNLLRAFNAHGVRYLLVGGFAVMLHGYARTTQDMDVWVESGDENRQRLIAALRAVGVAGADLLRENPLLFGWTSLRFGKDSFELDLGEELKAFRAPDFDACYERATQAELDGIPFRVLHLADLLREKRSTGRLQDLADAEELEKIAQRRAE
jgi:predicted nucleotidyltransferase